jgi:NAD(P)-dependent dehydrogenase (short-subunit alcohol dehydrogenase family)
MAGRVAGKAAFVTGAAQGLGEAIGWMLAREGAKVALTDLNKDKVETVAAAINAELPGHAFAYHHDVTDPGRWQTVLAEATAAMGGLNILVNNAGIAGHGDVEVESYENWKKLQTIDVDSIFLGCKYAMRHMRESGRQGSIVNISSIAGLIASHVSPSYNAAKAAVWMLSKSVALHGARMKPQVRSNSVHPVFIKTPILDGLASAIGKEEAYAKLGRQIPLGHIGEPDDVAYLVLFLASDESKFITGAEFKVDGGISAL